MLSKTEDLNETQTEVFDLIIGFEEKETTLSQKASFKESIKNTPGYRTTLRRERACCQYRRMLVRKLK